MSDAQANGADSKGTGAAEPEPAVNALSARADAGARPAGTGFDPTLPADGAPEVAPPRKGPLSFLSGSLTSFLFAWGCLLLSERVVGYYSVHPPHYSARMAQSIATAVKTLVVGMTFLATFTFAFVGLGLFLVFVRALFSPSPREST